MGKDQVTVAVQASGLTGPLGTPRLLVTIVLEGDAQTMVVLVAMQDGLREVIRRPAPLGPLRHSTADLWCAMVDDQLYGHLCVTQGVAGAAEDLPSSVSAPFD